MGFLDTLRDRQMLAQVTHEDELAGHLTSGRRVAYAGFDPTADSLHIGHLVPVLALRRWQQAGHTAIALVGGATAMVGDPTGKTEMRPMLSEEDIQRQGERLQQQLKQFLDFSTPERGRVVNNADWFKSMQYLPMLREVGAHFSVNRMLAAESFKQRMEKGLSFLEFNYMILQSYDFYHLHKTHQCTVQLGGDDQWSNMLFGMELIRRRNTAQAYCVTVPLLVSSAGKKMGKTESGAIWLDPNKTAPYDLFQYFRNIDDDMVRQCLGYFSDLPVEEVNKLSSLKDKAINEAKVVLAHEATKLIHGEEEANKARNQATALFANAEGADVSSAPEVTISARKFGQKMNVIDALVEAKVFQTKSEARRMIEQGGLTVGGQKVVSFDHELLAETVNEAEGLLIRKGKKNYYNLRLTT